LNGLNDWARTSNRICRILGLGEVFAWKFNFEDSLESRAAILLARADAAGNFAMRPRERRETKEQDLFRSRNALAFDRSSLTRWRQRMGEDKLKALLQESLAVATRTDAMKPSDLTRVVIDTTVAAEGGDVPDRR